MMRLLHIVRWFRVCLFLGISREMVVIIEMFEENLFDDGKLVRPIIRSSN